VKEPLWLKREWVDAVHFKQLQRYGGQYGVRDDGAIEAALARPHHKWLYAEERDLAVLASAYGYGLARNHGYIDGNMRVGFVAMVAFLEINDWGIDAEERDVVEVMLAVASGAMGEEDLAAWVQGHSGPATGE
jgi:death on curing protein